MRLNIRLSLFLIAACLSGCAYQNAGLRVYRPITRVDKNGHTFQRMVLSQEISADLPGIKMIEVDGIRLTFNPGSFSSQQPVYDRKGNVTNIITVTAPHGFYTSNVIKSQGEAFSKSIDSGAAGATGVLATVAGSVVTGGAISALAAVPK